MPAPSISLAIRDVSHNEHLLLLEDYSLNQHLDSAFHGVFSDLPVTINTIPYFISWTGVSHNIRSSAVVQKHTLEHTHLISSLGSIKNFFWFTAWRIKARAGQNSLLARRTRHFLSSSTWSGALFSMDSKDIIPLGRQRWSSLVGGWRLDDTLLMFWAHEVFNVVSDSLVGGHAFLNPVLYSNTSSARRVSIAIIIY